MALGRSILTDRALARALQEMRADVQFLREVAGVGVQRMANARNFYESLAQALGKAVSTIDLTHIRDHPPTDFGHGSSAFFDSLLDWVSVEGRSVRRVISVASPAMVEWAHQLQEGTIGLPQFQVRVIAWPPGVPALNMAIVDEKVVYLALTGSTAERTRGLGIEDPVSAQYFSDYFDNVWLASTPLSEWLRREVGDTGPQNA